jgi:Ca-activated chloride channel family protein
MEIVWTGPGNRLDYISIAKPSEVVGRSRYTRNVRGGSPLPLDVPEAPGTYEIRYVLGQSNTRLASRPLEVLPVTASLDAPAEVEAGAPIEVSWTGPANRRDVLAVAEPSAPGGHTLFSRHIRHGSPLTLTAPETPGTYEIRYIQGQSKQVLARRTIRVR